MATGKKRRRGGRRQNVVLNAFCVGLVLIILALSAYVAQWYIARSRIRRESARYAELYAGSAAEATALPDATATPIITDAPSAQPTATPDITDAPTAQPTSTPIITDAPSPQPTSTPAITDAPSPQPTATPDITDAPTAQPTTTPIITDAPTAQPTTVPAPLGADMPVVEDVLIPTPDADTLVLALPTPPPARSSFDPLLALNPETVGFLDIEGMLSLPVVQRENDNRYYLNHGFEGGEAKEGALFLDGLNRLVPEDDCLIVYGHNMKNDTMFGKLNTYEDLSYLKRHPVIRFDTLYEDRSYVAFSAFTASMEPGNRRYFDVRKFIFDEAEFDKFVLKLQSRSLFRIPVEVAYGDRLLLLVTCDYTNQEGRFILALRQVRADETEADMWAQVMQATAKNAKP